MTANLAAPRSRAPISDGRPTDLLRRRLATQHVAGEPLDSPADVVRFLVAVQSQDYLGAKWSVGQRTRQATDQDIDDAFARGELLRTHVMRPTWHFVSPDDIRWLLQLTKPRVHALNAYAYRQFELNAKVFVRCHTLFRKALAGGRYQTRAELSVLLGRAGIVAEKVRLAYLMIHAELEGLICSGPLRGKQHTYALLDERAPNARILDRNDALAELVRRFFVGHGPATIKHFVWWSGLSVADANAGLAMCEHQLTVHDAGGTHRWYTGTSDARPARRQRTVAYLIPEYDESLIGARDFGQVDLPHARRKNAWRDGYLRPVIIDGQRAGTWKRTIERGKVMIDANLFATLSDAQTRALEAAVARYGKFLGLPAALG